MSAPEDDRDPESGSQASEESFHSACSFQDVEDAEPAAESWNGEAADGDAVDQADASQFARTEADDLADLMLRVTVQAKPEGLSSIDARRGVTMFFRNEFQQSEDFLSRGKDSIPVFAVSHGVITMLKALMTFDEQVKLQAMARLNHAEALSYKLAGYDGFFAGIGKKFASVLSRKKKSLTKEQIEARISIAESQFAKSLLCFLDESVSGFVRGSMGMRRAWSSYNQCSKDIGDSAHLQLTPADRDGVFFGLGVFNLVLGIMPPRVLRIVKLLGFGGDRDEGLQQLHMCMEAAGVRSVLAVVALLAYHVLVPSFFSLPQAMSYHIQQADAIIQNAMTEYPGSAFLTFLQGRHERLKRNLPGSLEALTRSLSVVRKGAGADWVQFADLCSYELAWTLAQMQQWDDAADAFYSLYETNNWSKCFYVYACAVCRLMAGAAPLCASCVRLFLLNVSVEHVSVEIARARLCVGAGGASARHVPLTRVTCMQDASRSAFAACSWPRRRRGRWAASSSALKPSSCARLQAARVTRPRGCRRRWAALWRGSCCIYGIRCP